MPTAIEPLNLLAVAVGTIIAFLFGWLVYSPKVFGKGWAEGSGVALGQTSEMPYFAMVSQLVALALLSLVIGLLAAQAAFWTAILAILAAMMFVVSAGAFLKKSTYAMLVDGGYILGSGVLMILVQAVL